MSRMRSRWSKDGIRKNAFFVGADGRVVVHAIQNTPACLDWKLVYRDPLPTVTPPLLPKVNTAVDLQTRAHRPDGRFSAPVPPNVSPGRKPSHRRRRHNRDPP